MPSHAIHLGTAWEPPSADIPAWIRRFGRPAGVEAGDRLLLRCDQSGIPEAWHGATLNGQALSWRTAGPSSLECDVTGCLADRNVLAVPQAADAAAVVAGRASPPRGWGRLSLLIVSD